MVVVLSLTVGASLLARELYRRPDQPADDTSAAQPAPSSAGAGAESGTVRMSDDAQAHPQAEAVRELLVKYFHAINAKEYQAWTSVASAQRVSEQTPTNWKNGVRTTKDSNAFVYRIERGAGSSLRVLVGFTSEQNVADAPTYFPEPCIKWRLVLPVIVEDNALKIDSVEKGPPPEHEKC